MTSTTPPPDSGPRVTREQMRDISTLRRPRDHRMVAGVAEGLSRHFDVDPILIRVAFAALTLFGGAGLALYVIAWVTVPEEGEHDSALSRLLRRDPTRVMIAGLAVAVAVGAIAAVGAIGFSSPNPVPLIVVSAVAIALIAVFSRRRDRRDPPFPPPLPGPGAPVGGAAPGAVAMAAPPAVATADAPAAPEATAATPDADAPSTDAAGPPAGDDATREWWQRPVPPGPGGPGGSFPPPGAWTPPPPPPPVPPKPPRSHLFGLTMAVTAIALGIVWILDETVAGSMPPSVYPGTVLGVTAAALLVGTWFGRSRLLILVGIVAALATAATTAAGTGPYGQRVYRPTTAAAVQASYDHGIGRMVLHLEDVNDPEALDGQAVSLDQHIGQLEVVVPSTIPVIVNAHVDHGTISGPTPSRVTDLADGGEEVTLTSAVDGEPALTLDLDLDFGEIRIVAFDCPGPADRDAGRLDTSNVIGATYAAPACD